MKKCLMPIILLFPLTLAACGDECEQDYLPPIEITTSQTPYTLSQYSTDYAISGTRWENITTEGCGSGIVEKTYECFFPIGCGNWMHITNEVELTYGTNTVYIFTKSDGCEWREDYLITLE
ncbi:MAG: hypothetical protein C0608_00870 [Deltaproteobacteria bacterium]|nr:MAG: hypothetical protein C0608_00870 [Deltaproteobacteria bacterium]